MKVKKGEGAQRILPPEGVHVANLIKIIDLGTQKSSNPKYADSRKIRFTFELTEELHEFNEEDGEQPFFIDRMFNLNFSSKRASLVQFICGWLGTTFEKLPEEFELDSLFDVPCQLQVVYNEVDENTTYANIEAAMPLPKKMEAPEPYNEPVLFDLDDFDPDVFSELPDWMAEMIQESPEYDKAIEAMQSTKKGRKKLQRQDEEEEDEEPRRTRSAKSRKTAAKKSAAAKKRREEPDEEEEEEVDEELEAVAKARKSKRPPRTRKKKQDIDDWLKDEED